MSKPWNKDFSKKGFEQLKKDELSEIRRNTILRLDLDFRTGGN